MKNTNEGQIEQLNKWSILIENLVLALIFSTFCAFIVVVIYFITVILGIATFYITEWVSQHKSAAMIAMYLFTGLLFASTRHTDNSKISMDDFTPFCDNDEVYCKCRDCRDSQLNNGTCSHCFACIQGEKAMNICESYK